MTMSNESPKNATVLSGDTQNTADISNGRPTVEPHRQSDTVDDDETSTDSDESEIDIWEHLYTPVEMQQLHEAFQKKEEEEQKDDEEEGDAKQRSENTREAGLRKEDEAPDFNQLYLAIERPDPETIRRLLKSSVDANVLEANKNNIPQLYAIVKELLNKNMNRPTSVDTRNEFDTTSLHIAAEKGNLGVAHELLKNNAAKTPSDSCNIHNPEMGCVEIVKALIDHVGEINAVDKKGDTALHLAARNDRNALVKILFMQSANRKARSQLKLTESIDYPDELELSKQSDRNKTDVGHIPYHVATQSSNVEASKSLLSSHPSMKVVSTWQTTHLHAQLAAESEHAAIVKNLILNGANVNACNNDKMTPLHLACQNGHSSIVNVLLDNHATVDVTKQIRERPFYLAATNGHADVVDVLLSRGICDSVERDYNERHSGVYVATREHHTNVVEVILKHICRMSDKLTKKEQKVKETANDFTETRGIIEIEFKKTDDRSVFAGIVWHEANTSPETILESELHTALELAVKSNQPKIVKILLSEEQCVYSEKHLVNCFYFLKNATNTTPNYGYEAISKIKSRNVMGIMEFLCYNIQYRMKCKSIIETARLLLNSCKFNAKYQDDQLISPLHRITMECQECYSDYLTKKSRSRRLMIKTIDDMMQLLLEKGADFNMTNALGETPLIIASQKGCSHAIQTLFDWEKKSGLKLDLDARDQYGATALIKAAEKHRVPVMRLLLSHKVSVNLHDYYGFTALHVAVYEPNRNWFDLHFFCKGLLKGKRDYIDEHLDNPRQNEPPLGKQTVSPYAKNSQLEKDLEHDVKITLCKEEMVKLLLSSSELDVNAIDFRGCTPLDLAVKSSRRLTLETFKVLEDRGAIRNSLEPMDETLIGEARVDERGRGPLHRLVISKILNCAFQDTKTAKRQKWLDFMVHGFLLKPGNFRQIASATDDKGRTALHYAVMSRSTNMHDFDLMRVLLDMGSSVNAVDRYGKTPLHYAEMDFQYELLIEYGADISTKDSYEHTPKELMQLRKSVDINADNPKKLRFAKDTLCRSSEIELALGIGHGTQLSERKLVETLCIRSQSSRLEESSEDAIWNIWTQSDSFSLNRRINKLKPSIQRFVDRLADRIKEMDGRFEAQPILVGSASEETKAVISGDFDFNFKLIKLIQVCDVFPHPLGPKGYFQLRRKSGNAKKRQSDEEFDCFFNVDQCLLSNEVNSRFQIILEAVLCDPNFWQDEHLFERNLTDNDANISYAPGGLCKTVRLRMIHPIEDGEGGYLFVNVSIDAVACVQMEVSCLGDQLSLISPGVAADCTLVFDQPHFDPSKSRGSLFSFSDTFARISFAPVESRIIKESSSLAKAAYIVCKLILYNHPKTTYQLKTSLLFCMEALGIRYGCERKDDNSFTPQELAFWVERLLFCFCEFYHHDVFPCCFMPSFKLPVVELDVRHRRRGADYPPNASRYNIPFNYSAAFDIYLNLCPDDATIDIPIIGNKYLCDLHQMSEIANQGPSLEVGLFNREGFIKKLEPRSTGNR